MFDPKGGIPFVHFSHRLDLLVDQLKGELYPSGSLPFEKRMVVIPHLGMKNYLLHALAEDKNNSIAAGLEIVGISEAVQTLTKKPLPNQTELSLFLQYHLSKGWREERELVDYFEGKEGRFAPFAERLAQIFLRYALYGHKKLPNWQERLFAEVEKRWNFPSESSYIDGRWRVHLVGFPFLPKVYLHLFARAGACFYLFSPCEIFWGDFYSEKEHAHLQLDLFDEQNLFLSNWGKVGRKMGMMVEEENIPTDEHYERREGRHTLRQIQHDLLQGMMSNYEADRSVVGFRAPTPLRELQVLKDQILHLFDQEGASPRDIQVFAPDINLYAPFLEGVFSTGPNPISYGVSNLARELFDPVVKGVTSLLRLIEGRFAKRDLFHLLSSPPFMKRRGFCEEDLKTFERWCSLAHIDWGFSEKHRQTTFENGYGGGKGSKKRTWEWGLDRLLLGLGQIGGEGAPLGIVDVTEMELFSQFYTLSHSLYDDLSVFIDGTRWTLSTWLRYFATLIETYFAIEPGYDLYGEALQLASSCDDLDEAYFAYPELESTIKQLIGKKGGATHPPHLQAVRFSSLSEGCAVSSKVVCLLGMGEGAFPRLESPLSFAAEEIDFRPKMAETDRYLFLQILCAAEEKVVISSTASEGERLSPVVEELFQAIEGSELPLHPLHPFDPSYFTSPSSYSPLDFEAATQRPLPKEILIPTFQLGGKPTTDVEAPRRVEISKLVKFARHPVRFYLEDRLGIYPTQYEEEEFLLTPFQKNLLVREALFRPLEEVWEEWKNRGEIPENLFTPLGKEQVGKEVDLWTTALETFEVSPDEITQFSLKTPHSLSLPSGKEIELIGRLDLVTPRGVLIYGEDTLEDRARFAPHAAIAHQFDLGPLLGVKSGEPLDFSLDLPNYLDYFLEAWNDPSPLTPTLVSPLIEGEEGEMEKALRDPPDDVWGYLWMRGEVPKPRALLTRWSTPMKQLFGGVDATF